MNFMIPSHYGNYGDFVATSQGTINPVTVDPLTGRQQLASQGLSIFGQGLTSFFNWKTAQASGGMLPSSGGGYYTPPAKEEPNYTPVIIGSAVLGTLIIGGILLYNSSKGKK